jgi:hypothetical protein
LSGVSDPRPLPAIFICAVTNATLDRNRGKDVVMFEGDAPVMLVPGDAVEDSYPSRLPLGAG